MTRYSRQDVLRILHIHAKQLRAWERASLFPIGDSYSFQDLVQLRKLRDLRATRLSASSIRASIVAMRGVSGMTNPLLEAGTVCDGSRLAWRHSGATVEPIARQFVFDFEPDKRLTQVLHSTSAMPASKPASTACFLTQCRWKSARGSKRRRRSTSRF